MANLGEDAEALTAALVNPNAKSGTVPSVYAPCCGRRTDSDAVLDVRNVKNIPGDWLCNHCKHHLLADPKNEWTASKLARAAGLGWDEIRELRIKELLRERMVERGVIKIGVDREEIDASLPRENILGTEPPGVRP